MSDYGTANFMQQTMTVAPGAMIYSSPEALTPKQWKCGGGGGGKTIEMWWWWWWWRENNRNVVVVVVEGKQ